MCNIDDLNPDFYELTLSIAKVRFDKDTKIITSYVDDITLDLAQEYSMILSAIVFLKEGLDYAKDIYSSELSNSVPSEHSDLDTLDSLVRAIINTLSNMHGFQPNN